MKVLLSLTLALFFLTSAASLLASEEQGGSGSAMKIEQIIEECEKKHPEGNFSDPEERDKAIDQCIDDKTAAQGSGAAPE